MQILFPIKFLSLSLKNISAKLKWIQPVNTAGFKKADRYNKKSVQLHIKTMVWNASTPIATNILKNKMLTCCIWKNWTNSTSALYL